MSEQKFDAIVIGGGPNGLTSACLLAQQGKKVAVVEKNERLGGIGRGEEFHPGFRSQGLLFDEGRVNPGVVRLLGLDKFGLEFEEEETPILFAEEDRPGLLYYRDPEKTNEELIQKSEKDAQAYVRYRAFQTRIRGAIQALIEDIPPDVTPDGLGEYWEIAKKAISIKRLGNKDMMELLRAAPMCVADYVGEWFRDPLLKAGVCAPSVYGSYTGPWSPGTATNLFIHEATVGRRIKNGPEAAVAALEKCANASGVEVLTGAEVVRIQIEDQVAKGIELKDGKVLQASHILASCHPKTTFLNLVESRHLDYKVESRMEQFRSRGVTAKVNLALDGVLELKSRPGKEFERIRTKAHVDDVERSFDPVKYREIGESPALDIEVPSIRNRSLCPEGSNVVEIMVHFVPYALDEGWSDTTRDKLQKVVLNELDRYAPGTSSRVKGAQTLTPKDLEDQYGLVEGNIYHGEHTLDQIFVRPTPETARYHTPIKGLMLSGSGSHPGGGLTLLPGALAVRALRMRH